jgi:hypothetical protein
LFATRPESGQGVSHLIVASEDMMKFKAVEFLLKLPYLLAVGCHEGVMTVRLPYHLVDDDLESL